MVEFAFVMVLFFTLVFGILGFGFILSFKQNITRSAGEAARAGAVYLPGDPAVPDDVEHEQEAQQSLDRSLADFDQSCADPAITCIVDVHDCIAPVGTNDPAVQPDCLTVEVVYDYRSDPILPTLPFIDSVIPDTISDKSTAQVDP